MTRARRFVAILALLSGAAAVSSFTLGQTAGKKSEGATVTPQLGKINEAAPSGKTTEPVVPDRFTTGGVLTYQPVKGDSTFALQLQPKLPESDRRPRDYVILISTSAAMAGPDWLAARQITEEIIKKADERDQVSIWLVGDKKKTGSFTNGFLSPADSKLAVAKYLSVLRDKEYPVGADDLKHALTQVIASLKLQASRQRLVVYLGNGQSLLDPLPAEDRQALASQMVDKQIAFFTVPLGRHPSPQVLHGLAGGTGGVVMRTQVADETLDNAMKRYEAAFAGSILYSPKLTLPAGVTEAVPTVLPPLRSDVPTLVVGKMKGADSFAWSVTGTVRGEEKQISKSETVHAADVDNYFLVSMLQQWRKAKDQPAVLRADRALALAYEQARLNLKDLHIGLDVALEKNQLDVAMRVCEEIRVLAPHDAEADAGIKVIEKLKNGTLTTQMLKNSLAKGPGNADKIEVGKGGKVQWTKMDLAKLIAQIDDKKPAGNENPGLEQDLLQAHRDRVLIEEQKMRQAVEAAIGMARKELAGDPDGVVDVLRGLLARVKDHPDIGEGVRNALFSQLQVSLRESAGQARNIKLRKDLEAANVGAIAAEFQKNQATQAFQDRLAAQFTAYKGQMELARVETAVMQNVMKGMVDIQAEARLKGQPIPQTSQAIYTQVQAGHMLNQLDDLRRRRQEGFLSVILAIEKSHVPFPDEPGIYFPPLATWKRLAEIRKDKYEVSSLPNDDEGRKDAKRIESLLNEVIPTKKFSTPMNLKIALELFAEEFFQADKGKELPILVDVQAFKDELGADAKSPYDETVQLPSVPSKMTMGTALRLILTQVLDGTATYIIRRNFIEITTVQRALRDKVLRVYPVGDLVIPINLPPGLIGGAGGFQGGFGGFQGFGGGGNFGGGNFGGGNFGGNFGGGFQGGFGGNFGGGFGNFGGGFGGGNFGGGFGNFGGGFGGNFGGNFGGGFGGGNFGGGFGGNFGGNFGGGFGNFGGGFGGNFGGGNFGGGFGAGAGGQFQGGAFQGGFNGSLGALGASQAYGLILLITRVVDPGNWFYTLQVNPLQPMMMGFMGFGGFMMGFGMMMGFNPFMMGNPFMMMMGGMNPFMMMMMMQGQQPPPPEEGGPASLLTSNTIEFFPPALALIIRAPSRVHHSSFGGIVGGKVTKKDANAWAEMTGKDLIARAGEKVEKPKVGGANQGEQIVKAKPPAADLDPSKIWEDALAQGGIEPGLVIATADFLFENGHFKHAAEFLKANLRHGVIVRPWVYESLAVALEASGGDADEIRRARLSAVSLDPNDAQGFLTAARSMAANKEYDKAIAFCRQASALEPTLSVSYKDALAYADLGKDVKGMEWAVSKIVAQDWPADGGVMHQSAELRASALVDTLQKENRGGDAAGIKAVLQKFRQRDVIVRVTWQANKTTDLAEVEMLVKEPTGSICSAKQTSTPGGGTMQTCNLFSGKKDDVSPTFAVTYTAGEGFTGDYEITVRRSWGTPFGNRARLEIIQHAGTPDELRRIEVVDLTLGKTVKLSLKNGRRTELAAITPPVETKQETARDDGPTAWQKLRNIVSPDYAGAKGVTGGTSGAAQLKAMTARPRNAPRAKVADAPLLQTAVTGSSINMTAQLRPSEDGRSYEMVMQPIFQAMAGNRPGSSVVPGSGK